MKKKNGQNVALRVEKSCIRRITFHNRYQKVTKFNFCFFSLKQKNMQCFFFFISLILQQILLLHIHIHRFIVYKGYVNSIYLNFCLRFFTYFLFCFFVIFTQSFLVFRMEIFIKFAYFFFFSLFQKFLIFFLPSAICQCVWQGFT